MTIPTPIQISESFSEIPSTVSPNHKIAIPYHQDFDAVRKAHTHYLAALTSKSHLGVRPLMEGLHRLLGLCRRFCAVFLNYSSASDIPHAEVTSISNSFKSDAGPDFTKTFNKPGSIAIRNLPSPVPRALAP